MSNINTTRIVVVGGGFGGLEAAFYLRKRLGKKVSLTLISDKNNFLYKPGTIYIPFGKEPERYSFPLAPVLERRHIRFINASVGSVEPNAKWVELNDARLPYDYLILATGAAMRASEIPGLQENAHIIWTPSEMMQLRSSFEMLVRGDLEGRYQKVLFLVPPQNKCSGPLYEIVLMLDTWLRRCGARDLVELGFATCERSYLETFGPRLHEVISKEFMHRDIRGRIETSVASIRKRSALYQDGREEAFDLLVSFPPYVAATRFESLPSDARGFLQADPLTRQVEGYPDIYAVGDASDFPVKQAFLALLQADTAAEHMAERILGEEPRASFVPLSMCIIEQLDKATFAQVPLQRTEDPELPVMVREDQPGLYKVGSGEVWRLGKKLLGAALPHRFKLGLPFHAGASWTAMEAGLHLMASVFAD